MSPTQTTTGEAINVGTQKFSPGTSKGQMKRCNKGMHVYKDSVERTPSGAYTVFLKCIHCGQTIKEKSVKKKF